MTSEQERFQDYLVHELEVPSIPVGILATVITTWKRVLSENLDALPPTITVVPNERVMMGWSNNRDFLGLDLYFDDRVEWNWMSSRLLHCASIDGTDTQAPATHIVPDKFFEYASRFHFQVWVGNGKPN